MPKEYKQTGIYGATASAGKPRLSLGSKLKNLKNFRMPSIKTVAILGLVLILLAVAAWAGLNFYRSSMIKQTLQLQDEYVAVFTPSEKDLADRIVTLQSQVDSLQTLLKSHLYTSNILDILAGATLPQVQWDGYNLNVDAQKIELKGRTVNYSVLAKQILALQQVDGFSKVVASGIKLDKLGDVTFGVDCQFDPKIIQKK